MLPTNLKTNGEIALFIIHQIFTEARVETAASTQSWGIPYVQRIMWVL